MEISTLNLSETVAIKTEDFVIKCKHFEAKMFQRIIEAIKEDNGQKIETKFIKLSKNTWRIESSNFANNSYTLEELGTSQLRSLNEFANNVVSSNE